MTQTRAQTSHLRLIDESAAATNRRRRKDECGIDETDHQQDRRAGQSDVHSADGQGSAAAAEVSVASTTQLPN
ncbi:hypothetical protein [uncultured Amnibacterium sp.]|uniref:hypothetical protein n=1 Tax=uncultured Amnibacterium sp. TaxID=1631851 RepID=UPI0035CC9F02